jgi:DNA-binding response OmpR family regulator/HPt (histidine-containing phosphotransfer) domain-containing protein
MNAEASPLVLVAEDDPQIADVQLTYLRDAGLRVQRVARGDEVEQAVRSARPDVVVLDVQLPGLLGLDACKALRRFSDVPVLLVTSQCSESDRLAGFEAGADDYLCKPFSPRELVARVAALLRRRERSALPEPQDALAFDKPTQRVSWAGRPLDLTLQEYRLLSVMAAHPGRVFSRAQLLDLTYDDPSTVFDRAIDSHVKNLRRKLGAVAPSHSFIHASYGQGYRFEALASNAPAPASEAAAPQGSNEEVARVPNELQGELPAFLASRREALREMQQAFLNGDSEQGFRTAHRLAGSFALFGFRRAAAIAQRIERGVDRYSAAQLSALVEVLRNHLERVTVEFVADSAWMPIDMAEMRAEGKESTA